MIYQKYIEIISIKGTQTVWVKNMKKFHRSATSTTIQNHFIIIIKRWRVRCKTETVFISWDELLSPYFSLLVS